MLVQNYAKAQRDTEINKPLFPPLGSQSGGDRLEHQGLPFRFAGGWRVRVKVDLQKRAAIVCGTPVSTLPLFSRSTNMRRIPWSFP